MSSTSSNTEPELITINNQYASASISLLGANLISWTPHGELPVIWLSDCARFITGKSIRGGIPVCWPWFGAHTSRADFPAHGFTRVALWHQPEINDLDDGSTQLIFHYTTDTNHRTQWPFITALEYRITVGNTLSLELITHNHDDQEITLTQALHTYFNVSDIRQVSVEGLSGKYYLDKLNNFDRYLQTGNINFDSEVDRIYLDTSDHCSINDPTLNRSIIIKKSGSHSTVVWNPWQGTAEKMGDLGQDGYLNMLCVESANAGDDIIQLAPGQSHSLCVEYELQQYTS